MTVVNPKSISGINSITMASGSDDLLTIHSNNTTERVRVNNSGDVIVGSGVTLSPDGDVFATGVCTATSFVGSGANLTGIDTDLVSDTSPQLGGDLASNGHDIKIADASGYDGNNIYMGTGNDVRIHHDGSNFSITEATGDVTIQSADDISLKPQGGEDGIKIIGDGAVELYHDNTKQCETSANGLAFPSGKGIDFSATSDTGGMTSELLDDYEEGTWTPGMNNSITLSDASGRYIKTGHTVHAWFRITFPSTSSSGHVIMQNLPFANTSTVPATGGVARGYQTYDIENGPIYHIGNNSSTLEFYKNAGQNLAASNASTYQFRGCIIYQTA